MTRVVEVATPGGPARLHVDAADRERVRLVVGHGAGGGVEAPDLVALAGALPAGGVTVLRLEQPWRVAGKKLAGRPATLDLALRAALESLDTTPDTTTDTTTAMTTATTTSDVRTPVVLAGRSAGARSACRVAADMPAGVAGVLCLAFPLQPPGAPERSRAPELLAAASAGVPVHVVQGSRDAFGDARRVRDATTGSPVVVTEVPLADHAFAVPVRAGRAAGTSTDAALAAVVRTAAEVLDTWGLPE